MAEDSKQTFIIDGKIAAQYFKYYLQSANPTIVYPLQLHRIPYKCVYNKYKKFFDIAAKSFSESKIDLTEYIKWFVLVQHYSLKHIKTKFLDLYIIQQYIEYLKIKQHHEKIFNYFIISANKIAKNCIKEHYAHSIDYINYIINSQKLAQYYITGKISKYFLAAIPKFPQILNKLDLMTRNEFQPLCNRFDSYHVEVIEAIQAHVKNFIGPFSYVDSLIQHKI